MRLFCARRLLRPGVTGPHASRQMWVGVCFKVIRSVESVRTSVSILFLNQLTFDLDFLLRDAMHPRY